VSTVEPKQPERSLPELIAVMTHDLSTLMRQEVELAKEEIRVEARQAGKAAQGLGGAAAAGLYAGFSLVLALGFLLDSWMPTWVAFLVVTLVLATVAALLARRGRAEMKKVDPVPQETVTTLKEDARWLSEQKS
jgi:F0F1-type ATP synthase assembly protein I